MNRESLILIRWIRTNASELVFLLALVIVTYNFVGLRIYFGQDPWVDDLFPRILEFDGEKPWQYRILIPLLYNEIWSLQIPFLDLGRIVKVIEIGSTIMLVLAFRYYLSLFIKDKQATWMMSLLLFFILPFHYFFPEPFHAFYWFDTPSLLFFTVGMILLYKKKWIWFYPLFAVATLNRETTCFLTFIYLFTALGNERLLTIIFHCAAQFLIWMIIKTALFILFIDNPGSQAGFEISSLGENVTHFADNVNYFMNLKNWASFLSIFGFIWIPVLFLHGQINDQFVKRSLLVFIPQLCGMMIVANIYELRIFSEMIPVFLAAFCIILSERCTFSRQQIQ